jgi:hypothetical protein
VGYIQSIAVVNPYKYVSQNARVVDYDT